MRLLWYLKSSDLLCAKGLSLRQLERVAHIKIQVKRWRMGRLMV